MSHLIRTKTNLAARSALTLWLAFFCSGVLARPVCGDDLPTAFSASPVDRVSSGAPPASVPRQYEQLATAFAELIRDAIPLEYERKEDWGKTKQIPVGFENTGRGLRLRLRKREKAVNHGVWKHYRVTLVDPDESLRIRVDNLHPIGLGRVGWTVHLDARLRGWARAKVYNRGIHILSVSAEGVTTLQLAVDCEVSVRFEPAILLAGIVVDPVVTDARLRLDDFRLERIGELDGPLARELSSGLRHAIEDSLEPAKLTKKLNRAIDKKRDRLQFTPDKYLSNSGS